MLKQFTLVEKWEGECVTGKLTQTTAKYSCQPKWLGLHIICTDNYLIQNGMQSESTRVSYTHWPQ